MANIHNDRFKDAIDKLNKMAYMLVNGNAKAWASKAAHYKIISYKDRARIEQLVDLRNSMGHGNSVYINVGPNEVKEVDEYITIMSNNSDKLKGKSDNKVNTVEDAEFLQWFLSKNKGKSLTGWPFTSEPTKKSPSSGVSNNSDKLKSKGDNKGKPLTGWPFTSEPTKKSPSSGVSESRQRYNEKYNYTTPHSSTTSEPTKKSPSNGVSESRQYYNERYNYTTPHSSTTSEPTKKSPSSGVSESRQHYNEMYNYTTPHSSTSTSSEPYQFVSAPPKTGLFGKIPDNYGWVICNHVGEFLTSSSYVCWGSSFSSAIVFKTEKEAKKQVEFFLRESTSWGSPTPPFFRVRCIKLR